MITELSKRTLSKFGEYSTYRCNQVCLNDYVTRRGHPNMLLFREQSEIVTPDKTYDLEIAIGDFYKQPNETQNCNQQCPTACDYKEYSMTTSQALYPSVFYQGLIKTYFNYANGKPPNNYSFTNFGNLENTSLAVNIFYKVN